LVTRRFNLERAGNLDKRDTGLRVPRIVVDKDKKKEKKKGKKSKK
jgi:hypothetical protein